MRYLQFILVLKLSLSLMTSAVAQEELFIDKGVCPSDDLFILNYLGEGSYRVRHNGELIST